MPQESINGQGFRLIHTNPKRGGGGRVWPSLGTACQSASIFNYIIILGARGYRNDPYIWALTSLFSVHEIKLSAPRRQWGVGGQEESQCSVASVPEAQHMAGLLPSPNSHLKDCKPCFSKSMVWTFPMQTPTP